jgi:glycolate oxidase iron-sulfur subunit
MQTTFTPEQLQSPALAEADRILKTCNHYGFCTATCPTYVLLGDELDAPRGRIDLMHAMLAQEGPPTADTVARIDRCLSCAACMTTCAVNVDYMHLADIGRAHIERTYRRPLADRLIRDALAFVLPSRRRFRLALQMAALARPFRRFLPARLRAMLDLAPRTTARAERGQLPSGTRTVAVLAGCVQDVVAPQINAAAVRLLGRHGIGVVVPDAQCCGSLTLHMGREDQAKAMAKRTIDGLWPYMKDLSAIVMTASGCGTTVKDYGYFLRNDPLYADKAEAVSAIAKDVSEFLSEVGLKENTGLRRAVAYHDACSMRNVQKVTAQPRALLRQAGFEVHDVPENQLCCGSAGTYNILQPTIAAQLGERKAERVISTGAPVLAVGNIGCMTQLNQYLPDIRVVHTVELLDWATGGPLPHRLAGFDWPEIPHPVKADNPGAGPAGLW